MRVSSPAIAALAAMTPAAKGYRITRWHVPVRATHRKHQRVVAPPWGSHSLARKICDCIPQISTCVAS